MLKIGGLWPREMNIALGTTRFTVVIAAVAVLLFAGNARAVEVIPPKPDRYFNDYANVVSRESALRLNEQLAQFERDSSNQVVVAVFPKMQSDSDVADYTQRVAQSWGVGQKDKRNGAVLFVFVQDRKMFIQVGYGLEGALPDATAFDITEFRIKPHFRSNDYEGGLTTGVESILQAIQGEYKGSGKTNLESQRRGTAAPSIPFLIFVGIFILIVFLNMRRARKAGYRYSSLGGPYMGGWSGGSGGGWSSGGGGGGGFSGFGGGGGGFGGGGGGSSW